MRRGRSGRLDDHLQLYRANLTGTTRAEMQGARLAEHPIAGAEVSGTDTVAAVKQRVLPTLLGDRTAPHVTFVFGGRPMTDERLFYADHFMLLPSWVQVVLSDVPFAELIAAMQRVPAKRDRSAAPRPRAPPERLADHRVDRRVVGHVAQRFIDRGRRDAALPAEGS